MPIFARILDEKYIKTFFMINPIVKTIELPDGRTITLETGKLAKQADGSVMLRMGNTMLLATVCAAKDAVPGTDFMPLQVEYKENRELQAISATNVFFFFVLRRINPVIIGITHQN